MTHRFELFVERFPQELSDKDRVEKMFTRSLSYLCRLYRFELPELSAVPYPYNLTVAFRDARQCIRRYDQDLQLYLLQADNGRISLATAKTLHTGSDLLYIPVQPLCRLLQEGKRKKTAGLLLSVFAYLYHAGVPHYRESSNFVGNLYEMIEQQLIETIDEWKPLEYTRQIQSCKAMAFYGDRLLAQLRHPYALAQLSRRIDRFPAETETDFRLREVAWEALALYRAYPDNHIFQNIRPDLQETQECIQADQYLSFFWSTEDASSQTLSEYINIELQELSGMEEPTAVQIFDRPQSCERLDLDFETRLLALIFSLCNLLYDLS